MDDFFGLKGTKYWQKYKNRLNVTIQELPEFLIRFVWAPDLPIEMGIKLNYSSYTPAVRVVGENAKYKVGAYKFLKDMISLPDKELPSIVILGKWCFPTFVRGSYYHAENFVISFLCIDLLCLCISNLRPAQIKHMIAIHLISVRKTMTNIEVFTCRKGERALMVSIKSKKKKN